MIPVEVIQILKLLGCATVLVAAIVELWPRGRHGHAIRFAEMLLVTFLAGFLGMALLQ